MTDSPAPTPLTPAKPVYRVAARQVRYGKALEGHFTADSYQNLSARLGIGADNLSSEGTYGFNALTRNRQLLEFMYRGSWIVGKIVDAVAEDMTRGGVKLNGQFAEGALDKTVRLSRKLGVWNEIESALKWSRLYGGACLVHLVAGQDMTTPLDPQTIGKGQYRGLLALDRWMVQPSFGDIIGELGPDLGKPRWYLCTANAPALQGRVIHHSRLVRLDGIKLPFWQSQSENFWGMSVIERLYDRLLAFDSTTSGTAQLVFKAYLRTYSVENLRDILTGPVEAMEGLIKVLDGIRRFQTTEGLTVIDKSDELKSESYTFTGLSDVLGRFAEQLSGAAGVPLVRMFGQSPGGFSTGETDLQNYYDLINAGQNSNLYLPVTQIYEMLHYSATGTAPPDDFGIEFESLWQMSEKERAEVGKLRTDTILAPFDAGITNRASALRELANASEQTGVFGSITDDDVRAAVQEAPAPSELDPLPLPPTPAPGNPPPDDPDTPPGRPPEPAGLPTRQAA